MAKSSNIFCWNSLEFFAEIVRATLVNYGVYNLWATEIKKMKRLLIFNESLSTFVIFLEEGGYWRVDDGCIKVLALLICRINTEQIIKWLIDQENLSIIEAQDCCSECMKIVSLMHQKENCFYELNNICQL